jgi:hypothetical protein
MTRILAGIGMLFFISGLHAQNPAITFTASPTHIASGGSSTLNWTATCPTSTCNYSIDQSIGNVNAPGTLTVTPASTTTYTLQVNNASVGIFQATVTVFVGAGSLSVTQSTAPANGGPGCAAVLQYGVCELTYTYQDAECANYVPAVTGCSGGTVNNPWEQITIAATFTGQTSGKVYNIGGFYEGGKNSGNGNQWKVRFSPQTAELWSYTATFSSPTDYTILSNSALFTSTPGNGHGFLALNGASNPYILQTADGSPFYPFMFNMPGVSDLGNNSIKVGELFGAIGASQAPSTGYQTSIPGVGDVLGLFLTSGFNLIRNLNAAETPSYVIASLGVNNNVYLTGNTGATGTTGSMTYDELYRTEAQLGFHTWCTPVANAYAFLYNGDTGNVFTSPSITQEYMHAWQYIINRYAAYCDVWELGNELSAVTPYMDTMASWVKQQDPYKHLTAISYAGASTVPNLDLQSNHNYTTYSVNPSLTLPNAIANDIATQHSNLGSAPVIFGEAGQGGTVSDPPANEDFRQWQNVSFFNQGFESLWPNNICDGYNGANTECMDTQQLAQMALFSTFAGSLDPTAAPLSIALTGGTNEQTLKGYALGSSTDLAGYIVNTTNRTVVHGATVQFAVPTASMAGEWIAPSTGSVISTFTTANTPGSQTFTIPDFSSTAQTGDIWFRIRATATPVVMTVAAPGCLIDTSCPLALSAAGGAGGYTWAVTAGALPPGLTLNASNGAVTGTATQAGNWIFSVVATDSSAVASAAQQLILVVFPAIAVSNTRMDNFTLGFAANAYHLPIVITGGMPPVTCAVTGATPPGLSFNGFCGASGTVTTPGTYTFTVTATDSLGRTASAEVSTTVNSSTVGIEESNNPNATADWPFNWTGIGAREGSGGYTWAVSSGSLPAGLSLSSTGNFGTISGMPTTTGSTTFSLTATDSASDASNPVSYTLTVNTPPALTTSSLPSYAVGAPYYAPIGVSNGTPPIWCSVTGALPAGFLLDAASCELYGTTAAAGPFPITLTAYDSNGYNVSSSYTLSSGATVMAQTITFTALSNVALGVAPFTIGATASSGLTVIFTSTTTSVCTVAGSVVTILALGGCSITASQPGNAQYSAATPVTQMFTVNPAISSLPPAPSAVVPGSGSGFAQTFTFTFTDPAGYSDLAVLDVLINNYLDGISACYLAYVPSGATTGYLYLVADAGGGYAAGSPMLLSSGGLLQNSQCTIYTAGSSASASGNTLTLTLAITFAPGFGGNKIFYTAARSNTQNSGWQALGTWNVPAAAPTGPAVAGVSPGRGATMSGTYSFTFTDTNGYADLAVLDILTNSYLDGISACYVAYAPTSATTGYLYLVNDAGDGGYASGSPLLLSSGGTLQNSQCTINTTGSSASASGNTLTLNLAITFSPSFAGNRIFYLAARNNGVGNSGWQAVGSVTVP